MNTSNFYSDEHFPTDKEKNEMWANIKQPLSPESNISNIHPLKPAFHWKSFWLGNAAAVILIFAAIGIYNTISGLNKTPASEQFLMSNLQNATHQLDQTAPLLIGQAQNEPTKNSMESAYTAIKEIDSMISELKVDIELYGNSPTKTSNLKRLYATKLEFYQKILTSGDDL